LPEDNDSTSKGCEEETETEDGNESQKKMPAVPKTPQKPDKPLRQESMKKFVDFSSGGRIFISPD